MDRKILLNFLGIIVLVCLIVTLIIGHEITNSTKIMAFNYSDDYVSFTTIGDTSFEKGYVSTKNPHIHIDKDFKINNSSDYLLNGIETESYNIISDYNDTNSNGVNISFKILNVTDRNTNSPIEIYNLFVNCTNGNIYRVVLFGDNLDNKINNTAKQVFDTLKLK